MSEYVKEAQGLTQIPMEAFNFTWSIENFSILSSVKTKEKGFLTCPTFTTGESSLTKWNTKIGFLDDTAISMYLQRISSDSKAHHVLFDFSIIGSDKIKYHTKNTTLGVLYNEQAISFGFRNFIELRKLLEEERSLLLPGDKLTLMFELKIYNVDGISSKLEEGAVPQKHDSLVNDLQQLYENEMLADITLKVGDEELKVHKIILCARSSVFNTMLNCEMKENLTNCVDITDFDPLAVKTMLRYIYCGQVENLSPELSLQLYSIADKYSLGELKDICVNYLRKNIDVDNFCDALVLGDRHNELELLTAVKAYFCLNAAAVQDTEKWLNLSKAMPDLAITMYQCLAVFATRKN